MNKCKYACGNLNDVYVIGEKFKKCLLGGVGPEK